MSRKLIVDTDPGLDDARAIIFLLSIPEIEVVGVTTVAGNGYVDQVTQNLMTTLNSIRRNDIPVYAGTYHNMSGEIVESDKYFGENAFGNLVLPSSGKKPVKNILAPQAIVNIVNKYPNQVEIVAMGPLTNIGMAYMLDRSLPDKLKSLLWMGGDISEKTIFNKTEFSEFNSYSDPLAVKLVLENFGKSAINPLYVIDWKFCLKYPLQICFFDNIAALLSKKKGRENQVSIFKARPPSLISDSLDVGSKTAYIADEFPALICYDHGLITKYVSVKLKSVEITGPERGHTTFTEETDANIILVEEIDFNRFQSIYIKKIENQEFKKKLHIHLPKDCHIC
uniref:Putative uridine nucleosidase 1 (Trinotate prediction) n=1 Tax=Myxobolus squamalis TaxID=59785 RepID=A0A6B2G6E7_MYXSQ